MNLFPYQQVGADFLAKNNRAFLADEMGLGKCAQSISAAIKVGAKRVAVICPAIARVNWKREFDMWGYEGESFIESFDRMVRRQGSRLVFKDFNPDVVIIDEAHFLKNRTSKRTRLFYGGFCRGDGLLQDVKRVWLLSGTPAPNDVSEMWPHLSALWPLLLDKNATFYAFVTRYVHFENTPFGMKILNNRRDRLPELRRKLSKVMLRRRQQDVLKDLPPISWNEVVVEAEDIDPELKRYEGSAELKSLRAVLDDPEADLSDAEMIALASLRRMTGAAKAKVIAEMVKSELQDAAYEKVILFGYHVEVLATMYQALMDFNPVVVSGKTSPRDRQFAIDEFQKNKNCKVFIGQIQACGTAITLHAANQVIFAEASWTPSDNSQAAKRAHRIGQKKPVMVRMVGLAGSIDEAITRVLARKSRQISEVIDEVKHGT